MGAYTSHATWVAIGLRLDVQNKEVKLCRLWYREVESKEHYAYRHAQCTEIKGRYHCLFREGFGPLSGVIEYLDERCLGLFLMDLCRHGSEKSSMSIASSNVGLL